MRHELLLHKAELLNLCITHQPINVQRLAGLDDHRRRKRKLIDCFLLFFKREVIHFNELCVDTADATVFLTTVVNHEENATILLVVRFQGAFDSGIFARFHFELRTGEYTFLLIIEHTEADRIFGVEQSKQYVLGRDIHLTASSSKYFMGLPRRLASLISCSIPAERVLPKHQTSSHKASNAKPYIVPISLSVGLLSSTICG